MLYPTLHASEGPLGMSKPDGVATYLTRPAKRDLRGRMTIDIFSFLAPDVYAAHAFKESDLFTILRTTSYHYQCPICKETYHRKIDICDHVSNAHTRNISRTSSTSSLPLDASPLALKRRPCHLDEDIVANKRQRIDPSSTPPPSVSSANPEPTSDLTLIPSSPAPQPTTEILPICSSHRARRREVVKYFTLPMAGLYFHAPTHLLQVYKLRSVTTYVALKNTPAPPEKPRSLWGDLKTKLQEEGVLTLKDERDISRTQLSPLENVTKWHLAIETADLTQVRLYSRKPEPAPKPTIYHRLFDAFKQYIVAIMAPVLEMKSNTMLLCLINSSDK
ncbi:hypothetical protein EYR36_008745 [Pleurotus pulmonarius]|nr:hypothetical protein EYR36_008745 [Pleurotus pulmonarius]